MNESLKAALWYANNDWLVFPCHTVKNGKCTCRDPECDSQGKHPLTRNGVKDATTDPDIIKGWFEKWPWANVTVAAGKKSNLVVVDIDPRHGGLTSLEDLENEHGILPLTPVALTGGGGLHYYFAYPGKKIKNAIGIRPGIDIRSDGGYVIAPPGSHLSGKNYAWKPGQGPSDIALAEYDPAWLATENEEEKKKTRLATAANILEGVKQGLRDDTLFRYACRLRARGISREETDVLILAAAEACKPQFSKEKALQKIEQAWKYASWCASERTPTGSKEGLFASERLIRIAQDQCSEFFTDTAGNYFVQVPVNEHLETWPLGDRRFTQWIAYQYHEKYGKSAHKHAIGDARLILETDCQQGTSYSLYNRVGWHDDSIWYDLRNDLWQAVKISANGWEIVGRQSPLFYRYKHQLSQVTPEHGGKVEPILDFLNLPDDDGLKLLLQVYLVTCFVPDIPHPILVCTGPQGAAKSSLFRTLRTVFDPSITSLLSFPGSPKELVQLLQHNWGAYFDNVTRLPGWLSDTLCRASTGEGISKRRLYTDDEDVIYAYKRVVGINAITNPVTRADFLDRSIIINLRRISDGNRRSEKKVQENLNRELPGILGGCFDALAHAIKAYPDMDCPTLPRMADFAQWGAVIADAWGKQEDFLKAYHNNVDELNSLALESQPFDQAIRALMGEKGAPPFEWKGTASQLLEKATEIARGKDIDTQSEAWPGNAAWAKRRLGEVQANLEQDGIRVHFSVTKGDRHILLARSE